MTTSIQCSKCGRSFSSTESYQSHLPCHGSKTLGGAGDVYQGEKTEETGGSGGGRPPGG